MPARPRLLSLDALRGLAALLVVLDHASSTAGMPIRDTLPLGQLGVLIFFVISGFVIPLSLEGCTLGAFWRGRFWRLWPAYIVAVVLMWPLRPVNPLQFAANLTMAPTLFDARLILPPAWSLQVELLWYALAGLLVRFGARWDVCAVLLAGVCILVPVEAHAYTQSVHALLGLMVAGALLYEWHMRGASARATEAITLVVAGAVAWAGRTDVVPWVWALPVWVVAGSLIWAGRWPGALLWVGQRSYSLYLLHLLPLLLLERLWGVGWSAAVVGVLVALPLAWGGERWIERPVLRWAKGRPR